MGAVCHQKLHQLHLNNFCDNEELQEVYKNPEPDLPKQERKKNKKNTLLTGRNLEQD